MPDPASRIPSLALPQRGRRPPGRTPPTRMGERVATVVVWSGALLVFSVFLWMVGDLVIHGVGSLSWEFLTANPLDAGRAGGIGPILVSTILIVTVCMLAAIPIGMGTAILLAEYSSDRRLFGLLVRRSLDVLAGVPSIVFGLFGYAFFCTTLGMGFSILSGGLTLACMALPILIRSAEEGFRAVPDDYRRGAAALVLLVLILVINVTASQLGDRWLGRRIVRG